LQAVQSIPGGGPKGGYGYPDLSSQSADGNRYNLWEIKHQSGKAAYNGRKQLDRYLNAITRLTDEDNNYFGKQVLRGPQFPESFASNTGPTPDRTFNVTVQDSKNGPEQQYEPGVQTYEVDGGNPYVWQVAKQNLADEGATPEAEKDGDLTETVV